MIYWGFPGGPGAESVLPMQGAWVPPLVRELDPRAATKTLHATTKLLCNTGSPAWCSVMTHRSGVEGGGGGSRARGYIYNYD